MKTLKSLARALVLGVAIAAPSAMLADAQADELTETLRNDRDAQCYFGELKAPTFETTQSFDADLNGDGIQDRVVVGYFNKRCAIASATADAKGKLTYRGYSPLDAGESPKVKVKDLSGDGKAEIHIVTKEDDDKMITILGLRKEVTTRIFQDYLVAFQRTKLAHTKTTKLINFVDKDDDGIREISVSVRTVQLMGAGKMESEIRGTATRGTTVYVCSENGYDLESHSKGELSGEARLSLANALVKGGENLRARVVLGNLLKMNGVDDQLALAGMALMSKVDKRFGKFEIAKEERKKA